MVARCSSCERGAGSARRVLRPSDRPGEVMCSTIIRRAAPHPGSSAAPQWAAPARWTASSTSLETRNWAGLVQVASLIVRDPTYGPNSVAFSPDSSMLVVGTGVSNGGVSAGAGQAVLRSPPAAMTRRHACGTPPQAHCKWNSPARTPPSILWHIGRNGSSASPGHGAMPCRLHDCLICAN
jgi:hypothetical protein